MKLIFTEFHQKNLIGIVWSKRNKRIKIQIVLSAGACVAQWYELLKSLKSERVEVNLKCFIWNTCLKIIRWTQGTLGLDVIKKKKSPNDSLNKIKLCP